MPQLLVRHLEKELVDRLKLRAVQNGRSVEAEHREILRHALAHPQTAFKERLLAMPDVGEDRDFGIDNCSDEDPEGLRIRQDIGREIKT